MRGAVIGCLAIAAPIIWTAITDSRVYFGRGASVVVLTPGLSSDDGVAGHVLRTLGMFLVTGDPNQRQDVDALPLLGPVLFVLFAVGMYVAWRRRADHAHALLLLGIPVFLLPPLVALEGGAPHFLRALGLAPFVGALIGIGTVRLVDMAAKAAAGARLATGAAARAVAATWCAMVLLLLGVVSLRAYLDRPLGERYDAYSGATVALAGIAAGAGNAVIVDSYSAFDVRFLDADDLPTVVTPGRRIADARVYSLIVAGSRADIAAATDAATASRAAVAARDPRGQPVVFIVAP